MRRACGLLVAFALCGTTGCETEVELRLFAASKSGAGGLSLELGGAEDAGGGAAGSAGAWGGSAAGASLGSDAGGGTGGASATAGDSGSSAGDGGEMPALGCQKLGAEVCNGGDDDCDGIIDKGCPFTVKWNASPDGPALGNPAAIAASFNESCPAGSLLVGLKVGMGTRLDQVAAVCRQIELRLDAAGNATSFSFTSAPRFAESVAPDTSMASRTSSPSSCADGLFVSGLDGTTGAALPHYTQRVRIDCAPPAVANALLDFDRDKTQTPNAITCSGCSPSSAYNFHAPVVAGHVASGLFGRDGQWFDLVGIGSSTARVTPH